METIFEEAGKGRHSFYWNWAIVRGRLIVDGVYSSEQEALQFGYKNIPVLFQTINLSTKNVSRATQIIKHRVWDETSDIDMALKRAAHKKPEIKEGLI